MLVRATATLCWARAQSGEGFLVLLALNVLHSWMLSILHSTPHSPGLWFPFLSFPPSALPLSSRSLRVGPSVAAPPFARKLSQLEGNASLNKTVKCIIFDKDGTLISFHHTWSPWAGTGMASNVLSTVLRFCVYGVRSWTPTWALLCLLRHFTMVFYCCIAEACYRNIRQHSPYVSLDANVHAII